MMVPDKHKFMQSLQKVLEKTQGYTHTCSVQVMYPLANCVLSFHTRFELSKECFFFQRIVAELRAANMVANCNIALAFGDRLSSFVRTNFPRDDRAESFTCGRTKLTGLVNNLGSDIRYVL